MIFPEGSEANRHNAELQAGSLKLALRSNAVIIPLTIDGTYRVWEEHHRIRAVKVTCTIHKPVYVEELDEQQKQSLSDDIERIIRSALPVE